MGVMSILRWRRAAASATVVVGVATGIVINLVTTRFTVVLAVTLIALVLVGVGLALLSTRGEDPGLGGRRQKPSRSQRDTTLKLSLKRVEAMLNGSLRPVLPLKLALESRPDLGDPGHHFAIEDEIASRSRLPTRPIIEEFEDRVGRLILLGAAGSGKTTLLFELARDLIVAALQRGSDRIPITLNLSSWSSVYADFGSWLRQEICHDNYFGVKENVFRYWLDKDKFVLLLDGIDEVEGEAQRVRCCEQIAKFREDNRQTYIALCCRTADFSGLGKLLGIRDIIELQPPGRKEVDSFLALLERNGMRLAAIRAALETDNNFASFLCSPLVLQLVATAYAGEPENSTASLLKPGTSAQRLSRLWDEYIKKMFKQRPVRNQKYTKEQARAWLVWLAGEMVRRKTDAFQLDRLTNTVGMVLRQRGKGARRQYDLSDRCYRPSPWFVLIFLFEIFVIQPLSALEMLSFPLGGPFRAGVLLGIAYLVADGHGSISSAVLVGLLGATAFSVIVSRQQLGSRIGQGWPAVESVYWSRQRFVGRIRWSVAEGLLNGLAGGLIAGIRLGILGSLWRGITFGVVASIGIGAINGLEVGTDDALARQVAPDAGIRRSLSYALQFAIAGSLVGFLIGGFIGLEAAGRTAGIVLGIGCALGMGLFAGRAFGGGAYSSYYMQRVSLAEAHVGPWKYGAFLQDMTKRTILRRGDRAFFFVHRMLRDHLAEQASVVYDDMPDGNNIKWSTRILRGMRPGMRTDVFGRFRNDARELIDRAQEEARERHHGKVTPNHILLAMMDEPDDSAVKTVLTPSQVKKIRSHLQASMDQGSENFWGDIPLTQETKRIFRLSQLEASRLRCRSIGCEHVLLGLIRTSRKTAISSLSCIDVDLDTMRRKVAACSGRNPSGVPET